MQPHRQQPPNYPPQYGRPPQQWGPPRAPKKGTSPAVIVLAVIGGVLALLLVIGGAAALLGSGEETPSADAPAATTAAAADSAAAAGIPPEPDKANWDAYIAALIAIDPDIVHSKEEKAVDRGRNQCSSIKEWPNDQAKLVDLAIKRFTSPDHPEGFGKAKATKILAAVRKYICPTY